MDLRFSFANPAQREFFYATARNQLFSGGFNNGKTFSACFKGFVLLATFPRYRIVLARNTRVDLLKTTFETFKKVVPREFIASQNLQDGYIYFKNGSRVDLLHLDKVEESTLRGLEVNTVITDQSEEIEEKVYDILDARIGRWDHAEVPEHLLLRYPNWPVNAITGKHILPSYHINLCNPDTQFHHLYRNYHPNSLERKKNHFYVEGEWDRNLGSSESYDQAAARDDEFVQKYIKGQWGISNAQIHRVYPQSFLDWTPELWDVICRKGVLYRVLDHGDASPTCCLWFAAIPGAFICFREYYAPGRLISDHRLAIAELGKGESYQASYADPSIFFKNKQKDGQQWTTADEYLTRDIEGPPIAWLKADNNEFATRNRINELLKPSPASKHPLGAEFGNAPGLYFIKRSDVWPYGCSHSISELSAQRRELIGYVSGKAVYSDERLKTIADHAYDCVRYFVAMHGRASGEIPRKAPRFSLAHYRNLKMVARLKGPRAASTE